MLYSQKGVTKIFVYYLLGILPFAKIYPGVCSVIKSNDYSYLEEFKVAPSWLKKIKVWVQYKILYRVLLCCSDYFIPHLKKRGMMTFIFTVSKKYEFDRVLETGCSGIITDET